MIVVLDELVVAEQAAGSGVECDDRVTIEIVAGAQLDIEIGGRISRGHEEHSAMLVDGERRPETAAGFGQPRVGPRGSPHSRIWDHVEPPYHVAIRRIERIHVAGDTDDIPTGGADVHEAVPSDRRHRHQHAGCLLSDDMLPQEPAVARIESEHVRIGCAAEQPAVEVRKPAMHGEWVRRSAVPHVLPLLGAPGRIDGVGDRVRCEVQDSLDHDRTGLERRHLGEGITADLPELAHVGGRDLSQWREAVPGHRSVVGHPVPSWNTPLRGERYRNERREHGERAAIDQTSQHEALQKRDVW